MNINQTDSSKTTKKDCSELQASVLARLESEDIKPRSKLFFQSRECIIWTLWLVSVLLGTLAVAVSVFVLSHASYAMYEATHDNYLTFLAEFIPYLWLLIFLLMVGLAFYNFRHTKYGYRHPVLKIFLTSTLLSMLGGVLLYNIGLGQVLDEELSDMVPPYQSLEARETALWLAPQDGRLVGEVSRRYATTSDMVRFTDADDTVWLVTTEDLYPDDLDLLQTEHILRIVGFLRADGHFHACGVFPWLYARGVTMEEMANEREAFVERMYAQKDRIQERALALEEETYASSTMPMGSCADIAVIKRISESME